MKKGEALSNKITILGVIALTLIALAWLIKTTTALADAFNQNQAAVKVESMTTPDTNLRLEGESLWKN